MTVSLGIDLAAQDHRTAICAIEWNDCRACASEPVLGEPKGSDLGWILQAATGADVVGIDAPFGWPDAIARALTAWSERQPWPVSESIDLRWRVTDRVIYAETGIPPLSVSSDKIAVVAWRCAELLTRLAGSGEQLDRTGVNGVYEVYPGAAMHQWNLDRKGYKTRGRVAERPRQQDARAALVSAVQRRLPHLDLSTARDACIESDDALDALLAALIARAAATHLTSLPPVREIERTRREGWIHLPIAGSLEQLR
jgi:predicted nuclease with RNAse H fold